MSVSPSAPAPTLLEELDARQDDVLQQLDELNRRLEALLRAHGAKMPKTAVEAEPAVPPSEVASPSSRLDATSDQAA